MYKGPRKCKVIKDTGDNIPRGEFKIVITENNFIKKIGVDDNINTYFLNFILNIINLS